MPLYAALAYYTEDRDWTSAEVMDEFRRFTSTPGLPEVHRGGVALHLAHTATTITVAGGQGGDLVITDGPYAEAKEVLAGFVLLEAADLDEAVRWAERIPAAWHGKVELRPVLLSRGSAA